MNLYKQDTLKLLKTIYIALATLLMASCMCDGDSYLNDYDKDGNPLVPVSLTLKSRSMNTDNAPAGFTTDDINEIGTVNELINSYFVVFVHADGSHNGYIASIVTRDPSKTTAVQWEEITTKIPEGHYDIYAFANVSKSDVETAIGSQLLTGASMPDISNVAWEFLPTRASSTLVPMSNKVSVSFTSHANPGYAIEVVRMVGKVKFYFRNLTPNPLTVVDYSVTPLSSKGYLIGKGGDAPEIPSVADQSVTFNAALADAEALDVPVNTSTYTTGNVFTFYTSESNITPEVHPTGSYVMTFKLKRKYGSEDVVEEQRFALTPSAFSYIRRNQYILQPVTFTDWVLEPIARFYPPIGGYPESELESENSYRECYARFTSPNGGVFVIDPHLRNLADPDTWVSLKDETYVESYSITVDDIDGIFNKQPAYKGNEIIGTFNGNKGRGKITFNVTIKVNETTTRLYQRDLYIVNKLGSS